MKYHIDIRTVSKFAKRRSLRKYTREWKTQLMLFNANLEADRTMNEIREKIRTNRWE